MRRFLGLALLACSGCLSLDPFLYAPETTQAYVFDPNSTDPNDVVDASRIEPLRVPVGEQGELGAVYVHAVGTPLGHVFFMHGRAQDLDWNFPRQKRLSNAGFDVFSVDPRGWGTSSSVKPTQASIQEDTNAALAFLKARLPEGTPVSYYGHSLGTAIMVDLALQSTPSKLVLESGFTSTQGLTEDSSGMDFASGFISNTHYDNVGELPKIHVPLLLIHGLADDFLRPQFSEELYAVANEPKQLILVPGAQHNNVPETFGAGWETAMRSILPDSPVAPSASEE